MKAKDALRSFNAFKDQFAPMLELGKALENIDGLEDEIKRLQMEKKAIVDEVRDLGDALEALKGSVAEARKKAVDEVSVARAEASKRMAQAQKEQKESMLALSSEREQEEARTQEAQAAIDAKLLATKNEHAALHGQVNDLKREFDKFRKMAGVGAG